MLALAIPVVAAGVINVEGGIDKSKHEMRSDGMRKGREHEVTRGQIDKTLEGGKDDDDL